VRVAPSSPRPQAWSDAQEETLQAWARTQGHTLVAVTRDRAPGSSDAVDRRSGLHQALALIADRRVGGLVAARLDVLADEAVLQEVIIALILEHNGEAFTCDRGRLGRDEFLDPTTMLIKEALATFARLQRRVGSARAKARRRRKAAREGYAGGAPAFGLRVEAQRLVDDAAEQAALARISELRRQGHSLRTIARILTQEGHRPRRSERWHPESLRRIIARLEREHTGETS
jgi:DNA invertase Pin-like site-specific DNA recombinase